MEHVEAAASLECWSQTRKPLDLTNRTIKCHILISIERRSHFGFRKWQNNTKICFESIKYIEIEIARHNLPMNEMWRTDISNCDYRLFLLEKKAQHFLNWPVEKMPSLFHIIEKHIEFFHCLV